MEDNPWKNTVSRGNVTVKMWHSALCTLCPTTSRLENSKHFSHVLRPLTFFDTRVNEPIINRSPDIDTLSVRGPYFRRHTYPYLVLNRLPRIRSWQEQGRVEREPSPSQSPVNFGIHQP